MEADLIPVSVVIPTWNRAAVLRRTLESLAAQSSQPAQIILVDASEDQATHSLCVERSVPGLASEIVWQSAQMPGAASQRNQGVQSCRHAVIGFFDDDILFEADCVARSMARVAIGSRPRWCERDDYQPALPTAGRISRFMFRMMAGRAEVSYAGRVWGPQSICCQKIVKIFLRLFRCNG